MSDWRGRDEGHGHWPVRYPVETSLREVEGCSREYTPPRWSHTDKADTGEVQKRLLWLLLAVEVGMALAAACVLPLAFLDLPVQEEGVFGAILTAVGEWLGLSSQVTCLVLALAIPILLFTVSFCLRWWRCIHSAAKEAGDLRSGPGSRA